MGPTLAIGKRELKAYFTTPLAYVFIVIFVADTPTLDDVRAFLIEKIIQLLDRNPDLLMHILYRVDVAERDVKRVFAEAAPKDIPPHLADLLIERQLLKLKIRRTYREKGF